MEVQGKWKLICRLVTWIFVSKEWSKSMDAKKKLVEKSEREQPKKRLASHPPLIKTNPAQVEYFKDIVATIREPLLVLDADLRVLAANRSFYKFFKVKAGETIGKLIYDLGNRQWDIPGLRLLLETILPRKAVFNDYNVEHDFPVIGRRILLLNARRARGLPDKSQWILLAFEDVTGRMQLARSLQASEKQFHAVFETASDSMLLVDKIRGRVLDSNRAAQDSLGYSNQKLLKKNLWELGILKDRRQFRRISLKLEKQGVVGLVNTKIPTSLGRDYPADITIMDRLEVTQCNIHEITERKQAEDVLRENEERFSSAFEYAPIGMALVAQDGRFLKVNNALCDIVGYSDQELLAKTFQDITHPDDLEADLAFLHQMVVGEIRTYQIEKRYFHKSGQVIWVLLNVSLIHDAQGKPLYFISQIQDITQRKRAEEELIIANKELLFQNEEKEKRAAELVLANKELIYQNEEKEKRAAELAVANKELLFQNEEKEKRAAELVLVNKETVRHLQNIQALHKIDQAIAGSLDLNLTLNVVLEQVKTQLNIDAAAVLLLNPHTQILEFTSGLGFRSKAIERSRLRLGEGHSGRAALERRTVSVTDLLENSTQFDRAPLLADEGFVTYFGTPLIAKGQVNGVLEIYHRLPFAPDENWLEFFKILAGQAAIAVDSASLFTDLIHSNAELFAAYDSTIEGWSHALDLRDKETEGHTQRVTEMALKLVRAAGITEEELVHVRRGALLHDIGKMGVPDYILLKPDKLTDEEWVAMHKHPTFAFELLSPIAYLRPALDIPYCHHEKWDGSGYPRGLKGEQIPLVARLFAIIDVWDALRSDRPYRQGWSKEKVIEHIKSLSGTHFEPKAVELFLNMMNEDEKNAG
jgi:PAS domain S-box-containing protein